MRTSEEVWIESQAIALVTEWCAALGWSVEEREGQLRVRLGSEPAVAVVRGVRVEQAAGLLMILAAGDTTGPLPRAILEFVLRRNGEHTSCHWCVDRTAGLAVARAAPLSSLAPERFRDILVDLLRERTSLLQLPLER